MIYKNPVFVVGLPRSGTTLLQAVLTTLGGYFPLPETHFWSRASRSLDKAALGSSDFKKIAQVLQTKAMVDINPEDFTGCVDKKEAFERLLGHFNPEGKDTFLEKTPWHLFSYDEISENYRDARFICLLREPRNHAASIFNMNDDRKSMLLMSIAYNCFVREAWRLKFKPNFILVRYEDMCNDPRKVLENISRFLGLEFRSSVLDSFHDAAVAVGSRFGAPMENVITQTSIAPNNSEKWKETLKQSDANLMLWLCQNSAKSIGYKDSASFYQIVSALPVELFRLLSIAEIRRFLYWLPQLSQS